MVLILPENVETFKDNWTENVPNLFNDLNSIQPAKLTRSTSAGQFVSARLVVRDQIDDEIYFPTIKLKNEINGDVEEKVAAFRESVNIPGLNKNSNKKMNKKHLEYFTYMKCLCSKIYLLT